jgi:hypothetical protein
VAQARERKEIRPPGRQQQLSCADPLISHEMERRESGIEKMVGPNNHFQLAAIHLFIL